MAMKMMKKVLSAVATAALAVSMLPAMPAQAANVIVTYNFENGTAGMTSTGYGTDPTVVQDAEMGNVLQFADGTASVYDTTSPELVDDAKGINNTQVKPGTVSSLSFDNPFAGKSLTGMSFSLWVKVNQAAIDSAAGLVGWVTDEVSVEHPDKRDPNVNTDGAKDHLEASKGPYVFGLAASASTWSDITTIPMLNMAGLHHNWYTYVDEESTLNSNVDKWVFMTVSLADSAEDIKVYINGNDLGGASEGGKRFNHGEAAASPDGNGMEYTLTEILTGSFAPKCYVGFTGNNATSSGAMIDDLTFYDAAVSASEAMDLYTAAQAAKAGGASGNGGSDNAGSQNSTNTNTGSSSTTSTGSANGNVSNSNSNSTSSSANKNNTTTNNTTSNLPQTGVASTSAMVALGVAAVAGGAFLFKKKEA